MKQIARYNIHGILFVRCKNFCTPGATVAVNCLEKVKKRFYSLIATVEAKLYVAKLYCGKLFFFPFIYTTSRYAHEALTTNPADSWHFYLTLSSFCPTFVRFFVIEQRFSRLGLLSFIVFFYHNSFILTRKSLSNCVSVNLIQRTRCSYKDSRVYSNNLYEALIRARVNLVNTPASLHVYSTSKLINCSVVVTFGKINYPFP